LFRRQQAAEQSVLTSASRAEGEDKQGEQAPLQLAQLLRDAVVASINQQICALLILKKSRMQIA